MNYLILDGQEFQKRIGGGKSAINKIFLVINKAPMKKSNLFSHDMFSDNEFSEKAINFYRRTQLKSRTMLSLTRSFQTYKSFPRLAQMTSRH